MNEVQNGGRPSSNIPDELDFLKHYSREDREKIINSVMPIFSETHIKPIQYYGTSGEEDVRNT